MIDPEQTLVSLLRARITGSVETGGVWYYAWEEVIPDYSTGADNALYGGRYGTTTTSPATELNNTASVANDTIVHLRQKGLVGGQMQYEFATGSGAAGCVGCAWLAGMGTTRCLQVSVDGTATALYLTTSDGNTWTSADLLTICSVDYTVSVARNAGGVPTLTLTSTGSGAPVYAGQWNCCGCAFAKWGFNLQTLCPAEDDTGDPCTNVVEVRVDSVACPTPGTSCTSGGLIAVGETVTTAVPAGIHRFWHLPVTPGATYCVTITVVFTIGLSGGYTLRTFTGTDCGGSPTVVATNSGMGETTNNVTVTPAAGNTCLCVDLFDGSEPATYTFVVHSGAC